MQGPFSMVPRVLAVYLPTLLLLSYFPGFVFPAVVTLKSIEMYNMHEWVKHPATVYFKCSGENETILPDVTEANVLHNFTGEESWQPLTELPSIKCKRCGVYRQELWAPDDVFDEWELCPHDFETPDGISVHLKEKEFNATFICKECLALAGDSAASDDKGGGTHTHYVVIILISLAVTVVVLAGSVAGYSYWRKKKWQQEQARFLRLFEEGDDIEDELGLGDVLS